MPHSTGRRSRMSSGCPAALPRRPGSELSLPPAEGSVGLAGEPKDLFLQQRIHCPGAASYKTITTLQIAGPGVNFPGRAIGSADYKQDVVRHTFGASCTVQYPFTIMPSSSDEYVVNVTGETEVTATYPDGSTLMEVIDINIATAVLFF